MNDSFDLARHNDDLVRFVDHYRWLLATRVVSASTIVLRALHDARISPWRLSILAARVARDPDWNSGFEHRCLVVVRPAEHPRGRLGFWEENGHLCMELQLGADLLTVRGASAELRLSSKVHEQLQQKLVGWLPRDVRAHEILRACRGRILAVECHGHRDQTTVLFRTNSTPFQPQR